jgi:hypothetical protein
MKKFEDMSKDELMAEVAKLQKEKGKSKGKRKGEEYYVEKYPNTQIVPGSLRFLADENKQAVDIRCNFVDPDTGDTCGEIRTVRTSDLHQVDKCKSHMAATKRARKKEKQADLEAKLARAEARLAELGEDEDLD